MRASGSGKFITAMAIAVLFGIVHIIGPGHGKLFNIGYFGSRRAKFSGGIWLSALVNIIDSLSALLLVGIAYGILSVSITDAGASTVRITRLVAYGMVTLLGTGYLLSRLRPRKRNERNHDEGEIRVLKPWMSRYPWVLFPAL